ncbi:MAG: hypothetical protein MSA68_01360, partial [Helicobacter sp.]|nr:hypothetical protein [Helicobacter sp.]
AQTPKMVQKATNEAELFGNSEQLQAKTKEQTAKEAKNITFIDAKGKEREITKQVQEQWLETFNLKSLDEIFIPKLPQELQKAIGKEIKLTKGSLYKIVERGREQYIPQIRETLEKPDFAIKDTDNILIIAKEIGDKQYFTSINLETKDYFISISNAPKKENILKNKVQAGAEVVYQSPNAKSIFYTDTLLQEGKSPTNEIDNAILPQPPKTTQEIIKEAKEAGKSGKEIVQAIKENKAIKEFGTNYAEFYHDGLGAIQKLLTERQGQVAGAFYRQELEKLSGNGDITLVWGEVTDPKNHKGYGLSKIESKHLDDFAIFEGKTPQEKMANGINEIIEKGKIVSDSGIDTIIYKKGNNNFRVGLSKGFKGIGDDSWIITAYKADKVSGSDFLPSSQIAKSDGTNLHSNTLPNKTIPNQTKKQAEIAKATTQDAPKTTQEIIKEAKEAGKSGKEIVQAIKENKAKKAQTLNSTISSTTKDLAKQVKENGGDSTADPETNLQEDKDSLK